MARRSLVISLLVLAVAAVAAAASGAGGTEEESPPRVVIPPPLETGARGGQQVARVAAVGPVEHLDPALARTPAELAVVRATCTPILRVDPADPDGRRLLPGIADLPLIGREGRRYRFHVLPGATFSGGEAVRAEDVARTLARLVDPTLASPWAPRFAALAQPGARIAVDGTAVDIALPRPDTGLPWALALAATCPVPAATPSTPVDDGSLPATGAYRITTRTPSQLVLERVASEAGRAAASRRVEVAIVASGADALRAVRDGTADLLVGETAATLVDVARGMRGVTVDEAPGPATAYLELDVGEPALRDRATRAAIAVAVDRDALAAAWPGAARPAARFEPPATSGADVAADARAAAASPVVAAELLGERPGPLVLPIAARRGSRLAALAGPLSAALARAGIAAPIVGGDEEAPLALRLLVADPTLDDAPLGRLVAGAPRSRGPTWQVVPGDGLDVAAALTATGPARDPAWARLDAAASAPGWVAIPLVRPRAATLRRSGTRVVVSPADGPDLATLVPAPEDG